MKVNIGIDKIERIEIYCNTRKKYKSQIVKETGCDYALNAAFFSRRYKPLQTLRVNGGTIAKDKKYNYFGYGWDSVGNLSLTDDYKKYNNFISCMNGAINGMPVKMYYNKDVSGLRPRSAMGLTKSGLVLYCEKTGRTPEQVRDIMLKLGCTSVVVFDGGGSTQGYFNGVEVNSSENNGRGRICYSYILVYLKKDKAPIDKQDRYTKPTRTLRRGHKGEDVKWLQYHLNRLGYDCGSVDGIFGFGTYSNVCRFQKNKHLQVDGIVGNATINKIIELDD